MLVWTPSDVLGFSFMALFLLIALLILLCIALGHLLSLLAYAWQLLCAWFWRSLSQLWSPCNG